MYMCIKYLIKTHLLRIRSIALLTDDVSLFITYNDDPVYTTCAVHPYVPAWLVLTADNERLSVTVSDTEYDFVDRPRVHITLTDVSVEYLSWLFNVTVHDRPVDPPAITVDIPLVDTLGVGTVIDT